VGKLHHSTWEDT